MPDLLMVKDGHLGGYVPGGDPGTWCPRLWTWAIDQLDARSVLDVGCGEGHSTRFFRDRGCQVQGVDGCEQAIRDSVVPGHVVQHDFCSGPFVAEQSVDLIWCCEFLEHVEEQYLPHILGTFASARKAILITHAFPGQRGHHHVNLRRSSYWIQHIESLGFRCDGKLSLVARQITLGDCVSVNHFARSGLVFVRRSSDQLRGTSTTFFTSISAECRATVLDTRFRWSAAFREHKRKKRAAKRARRQLA